MKLNHKLVNDINNTEIILPKPKLDENNEIIENAYITNLSPSTIITEKSLPLSLDLSKDITDPTNPEYKNKLITIESIRTAAANNSLLFAPTLTNNPDNINTPYSIDPEISNKLVNTNNFDNTYTKQKLIFGPMLSHVNKEVNVKVSKIYYTNTYKQKYTIRDENNQDISFKWLSPDSGQYVYTNYKYITFYVNSRFGQYDNECYFGLAYDPNSSGTNSYRIEYRKDNYLSIYKTTGSGGSGGGFPLKALNKLDTPTMNRDIKEFSHYPEPITLEYIDSNDLVQVIVYSCNYVGSTGVVDKRLKMADILININPEKQIITDILLNIYHYYSTIMITDKHMLIDNGEEIYDSSKKRCV